MKPPSFFLDEPEGNHYNAKKASHKPSFFLALYVRVTGSRSAGCADIIKRWCLAMTTLLHFQMQDGDWVKGKTNNDELFHGYIESIHHEEGIVKVRVIQSDNRLSIGKISDSTPDRLRPLETPPLEQEGHIRNWIDIALSTKDEAWFMELTNALRQTQKKDGENLVS